ncbi:hypothetical protein [Natrarchaeobius oligotrophus]|uniref:hypothetical protein n=1 Tax=Natrarchaeobius oligotrophus TaxID=3455743 RepID=UPI001FB4D6ED|nr:hypothetical protein [Natrarchaeobius chitinivorans]
MTGPTTNDDERGLRKSTLFCWECGHASPIDGDWVLSSRGRSVAYGCPVCETMIDKRPTRDSPGNPWQRLIRRSARVWRANLAVSLSATTAMARYRPDHLFEERSRPTDPLDATSVSVRVLRLG